MKRWRTLLVTLLAADLVGVVLHGGTAVSRGQAAPRRPNILLAIADDWSYPHASVYGDRTVRTPVFDRVAREGVLFSHAFTAAPSCTPARAALLTGQYPHRLEQGAMLHGFLPARFTTYPDLLEAAGYHVGFTRKGWSPGRLEPGGRSRNPAGPTFTDFEAFLAARRDGQPFAFWFGSQDPHRPYERGSGAAGGLDPGSVAVPAFLPDTQDVRGDLADYYFEVQRFDREVGEMLRRLEQLGELDHTLVVITSDNGMPFPRAKANVYDAGARLPLAMRWPGRVRRGLRSDAFVSTSDLAATFVEAAGLPVPASMTARSLLPLAAGSPQPDRDRVFIERERHANVRRGDLSYPVRAVRTADFLYIRNLRPDRWPAGDPETYVAVGPFGDIDGGPTKSVLLDQRTSAPVARFFDLATGKRPAEELYDLRRDPGQLTNIAARPSIARDLARLRGLVEAWMRESGDPRATSDDDRWDSYPYYGGPAATEPVKGSR